MAADASASQTTRDGELWIICGNSCAGKTTTAQLLAKRFALAAQFDGDEMQRVIVSGCRWAVPEDTDPVTNRLTGEAGFQYALRVRNACVLGTSFADAGVTAVVTDTIIGDGFDSMADVLRGRTIYFVVLRPPLALLRERGLARLVQDGEYLEARYGGDPDHPEGKTYALRLEAAAAGEPVNEFDEIIERGLDQLPPVGLHLDPSGLAPEEVVDVLLARRADASWTIDAASSPVG